MITPSLQSPRAWALSLFMRGSRGIDLVWLCRGKSVLQSSQVTQGKESTYQRRRLRFGPWIRRTCWRRQWQATPVFLPGKSHGQRRLLGYSPWVHSVGHDWATEHARTHSRMWLVENCIVQNLEKTPPDYLFLLPQELSYSFVNYI